MRAALAIVLLALAMAVCAVPPLPLSEGEYQLEFANFVGDFNKEYENAAEFFYRFSVFKNTLDFVREHNSGNSTWQAGINEYADRTQAEFAAVLAARPAPSVSEHVRHVAHVEMRGEPKIEVDWRKQGAVSPVGNQGQCGSCWAFSCVSALEGWCVAVRKEKLSILSVQQLMDCAGPSGNQGCNGGWPEYAFDWIVKNGGLCTAADYGPYIARDAQCKKGCTPHCPISGSTHTQGEDNIIKLLNQQPVSVAVTVEQGFQVYKSGVYDTACRSKSISHTLLIVGYTDTYYMIKNSWGTSWGAAGYINMIRNKNICDIGEIVDVVR